MTDDSSRRLYLTVVVVALLVMALLYLFTAAWNLPLEAR